MLGATPVQAEGPTPGGQYDSGDNKEDSPTVAVATGPTGVTIYIAASATNQGEPGSDGGTDVSFQPGSAPSCGSEVINVSVTTSETAWWQEGSVANPDAAPWFVSCDNGYAGVAWVPFDAPGNPTVVVVDGVPGVDPATYAASMADTIPLPTISVAANPGVGLVAMESWFWMDGYDGAPLSEVRSLGLTVVEVQITPESYRWLFGDGTSMQTSTSGRPYPEESEVRHTYERSSLATGGAYDVVLEITFSAQYRIDGGDWIPLPPMVRGFSDEYPVRQLQAVLGGG